MVKKVGRPRKGKGSALAGGSLGKFAAQMVRLHAPAILAGLAGTVVNGLAEQAMKRTFKGNGRRRK